ncbi:MAG: hypothetical protein V9E88_13795 [Ferruginibacter sp.]
MSRKMSVWIRRIKGTLPPDAIGADGLYAQTHLCAVGVSGQGKRISIAPAPFFGAAPERDYDIERNTITPDWIFNLTDSDTEYIFCMWMLESDNKSIARHWSFIEQVFNNTLDRNLEKLQPLGYPEQQLHFTAFTESILQLHLAMQSAKSMPSWPDFDNDDVYLPGIFHFSHITGNTLPATGIINDPVRNDEYEGFCNGTCYIDPQHPFDLTFRYLYSPASGPILSED